ncbi:MAG TPA: hypothetical protein VH853_23635 [Polyangia bacterium]|jgi:hypothetical protein|nr:hypothetical protein [Polyangia bacterium]
MTTRIFNALLGIWLFVTAFMWPHPQGQEVVTIAAAILTFALAILSIYTRAARYLNVVVAIILFLSALTIHSGNRATMWNNAIVAIAIFVSALVDKGPGAVKRERELYGRV